ncbi:hypothetical protein [Billgrantia endophytica]
MTQLAVRSQHMQRWQVPRNEYRRDQGKRAGPISLMLELEPRNTDQAVPY